MLNINVQGDEQIRVRSNMDACYILINLLSFKTLKVWLQSCCAEDKDDIQKRLAQAKVELQYTDTLGDYDKTIVNDDLAKVCKELDDPLCSQTS